MEEDRRPLRESWMVVWWVEKEEGEIPAATRTTLYLHSLVIRAMDWAWGIIRFQSPEFSIAAF